LPPFFWPFSWWINIHMKKILIQYLWLFSITLLLLIGGIAFHKISLSEQDIITKEWIEIDKELQKERIKNDNN